MFKIKILKIKNPITTQVKNILDIPYYDLIKVEAVVQIYINNVLFFSDDYFPILEFLYQFEVWKSQRLNNSFEYNTIESMENPIISFRIKNQNCILDSVWKLTHEVMTIDSTEVFNEVEKCKIELLKHMR